MIQSFGPKLLSKENTNEMKEINNDVEVLTNIESQMNR